uniref:2'-phosphotransferase n=1 Tax=Stomoxys calcitrans TaxID=35570 RepID=A0A1I8PP72_STOCA
MLNKTRKPLLKEVILSKKLSWLLRHGAAKEGINIQADGFIKVSDILQHPNYRRDFNMNILRQIVDNDAKQRYTLRKHPVEGHFEIRANQGHSLLEVKADECLQPITKASEVPLAVHGTYYRHWPSIKAEGLKRFTRNHVHFATSDDASDNISGFRSNCQILIYLDTKKLLDEGCLKLFRSDNSVILCSGLPHDGSIPSKYFLKVVDRKTGQLLEL